MAENEKKTIIMEEETNNTSKEKNNNKMNFFIIPMVVMFLIFSTAIGAFFVVNSGIVNIDNILKSLKVTETTHEFGKYEDIPLGEITVTLGNTANAKFLKANIVLAVESYYIEKITNNMINIQSTVETFLREIDEKDLSGAAGIYNIRQNIMRRVNNLIGEKDAVVNVFITNLVFQ